MVGKGGLVAEDFLLAFTSVKIELWSLAAIFLFSSPFHLLERLLENDLTHVLSISKTSKTERREARELFESQGYLR